MDSLSFRAMTEKVARLEQRMNRVEYRLDDRAEESLLIRGSVEAMDLPNPAPLLNALTNISEREISFPMWVKERRWDDFTDMVTAIQEMQEKAQEALSQYRGQNGQN